MSLGAEDYREGAKCRLDDALSLFGRERWQGAVYLGGRAAESMLRSLLVHKAGALTAGHDLRDHLKAVRSLGFLKRGNDESLQDAINELAILWRNDLRFTGERRFRRLLVRAGRHKKIGAQPVVGDPEKPNARALLNAAEAVLSRGELIWQRLKKN